LFPKETNKQINKQPKQLDIWKTASVQSSLHFHALCKVGTSFLTIPGETAWCLTWWKHDWHM